MECIVNCVLSSLLIWGVALHLTRIATEMLTNVVSMGDPELSRLMYEPLVYMQVLQMLLHDPYLRVKNRRSMCTAQNMSAWGFERHVTSASNSSSPSEMPFFMENVNAANSTVNATDSSFSPRNGDAFSSESDFTTEEYLTELGRLPVDWKFKAVSVNDQLQLEGSFADLRRGKQVLEMKKLRLAALLQEIQTRSDGFGHSMATAVSWYNSVTGTARGASYVVLPLQAMAGQFQFLADGLAAQLADVTRTLNLYEQSPGFRGPGMDLFGNPSSFPHTHTGDGQAQNSQDGAKQLSTGTFQDQEQPWRPQRGLPERAVKVLRGWLFENFLHPYPKDAEKVLLARQTGLSRNQVSNWFINARVRLWKPMVEDMYEDNIPQEDPESPEVPYDFRLDYHKFSFPAQDHSSNSHLPINLVPSEPSQFEFFSAATHDHMVSNHHTLGSEEAMVIRGQGFLPNLYTGTDSSRSDTGALFGSSSKDLGYDWNHQPNLMSPSNPGVSAFASPLGEAFTRFHSGSNSDFQIGPGSGFVSNLNDFPMTAHGVSLTLGLRHPDLSAFHGEAASQPSNEDDTGYSTEISISPPRYASNGSEVLYNTISGITPGPTHYLPQEEVLGSSTMNFMQLGTAGNEVNVPLTLSPMCHGHSNPEEQDLYDLTRR